MEFRINAMNVTLSEEWRTYVAEQVREGRFPSDAAVVEAGLQLLREQMPEPSPSNHEPKPTGWKPIWERAVEIMKDVPDDELAKLPVDGAEQVDHYVYGTPKRSS